MTPTRRIAVFLTVITAVAAGVASSAEAPRVIRAVRAATAPTIDGRLDDACWKEAPEITGFLIYRSRDLAISQSYGYVCYDDSYLYIGMKCLIAEGTEPVGEPGAYEHDDFPWAHDRVEIMLDPGRTETDYYQLAMTAYGATFDCSRSVGGTGEDDAWNGEWEGKSYISEGYWSVELAVPYHNLGITPEAGSAWGVNLCRGTTKALSSISVRGAFNDAEKFVVLEDLDADFNKYFFHIEPSFVVFEPTREQPWPVLNMRVTNLTGKPQTVKVDVHRVTPDDKPTVEARQFSFSETEAILLQLETLEIDALAIAGAGRRAIRVEPRAKKVVVTDAESGRILSLTRVREQLTWVYKAITLEVDDAWPEHVPGAQPRDIDVRVHVLLPKAHLDTGTLVTTLTSRKTGEVVISRNSPKPGKTTEMTVAGDRLPWGAYDVRAWFEDANGRELVASETVAVLLPGGKQRVKRLNNVTCELMDTSARGLREASEIEFMNPRDGWCFFRLSGNANITLDAGEQPLAVSKSNEKPVEAMRHLPAGRHLLRIDGTPSALVVRAIPELLYHEFPQEVGGYFEKHVLNNVNTFNVSPSRLDTPAYRKWQPSGRRWLAAWPVLRVIQDENIQDYADAYKHISVSAGYTNPLSHGLMADEFMNSEPNCAIFADAVRKLNAAPEFADRFFYAYVNQLYGGPEGRELVQALSDTGAVLAWKRYLPTHDDEQSAREFLHDELVEHAQNYRELCPGSLEHIAVCFGYFTLPGGHLLNGTPWVNYKKYLDMQFNLVATDPAFLGTYGLMTYHSGYADEETVRWGARLFRHYGIEGKAGPATSEPYVLPHLVNTDFVDGLTGWTVDPAEKGGIRGAPSPGFGRLQARYGGAPGDTALVTVRSAARANRFSQEIRDLRAGKLYSFRMMTSDFKDMSKKEKHAVAVKLDNVTLIPERTVTQLFPNPPWGSHPPYDGNKRQAWITYHWYLFRANGTTAKLTVSDWADDREPGGEIGQELMYNFVHVQSYFESEPEL
ncbi:MAG: sugar-binding protein [Lentisphaeria bacterium]|nr:sugar-binding protein [Lentisphaeria bacterium]